MVSNETVSCSPGVWCRTVTYSTGSGLVTTRVMCSGIGSSDASNAADQRICFWIMAVAESGLADPPNPSSTAELSISCQSLGTLKYVFSSEFETYRNSGFPQP